MLRFALAPHPERSYQRAYLDAAASAGFQAVELAPAHRADVRWRDALAELGLPALAPPAAGDEVLLDLAELPGPSLPVLEARSRAARLGYVRLLDRRGARAVWPGDGERPLAELLAALVGFTGVLVVVEPTPQGEGAELAHAAAEVVSLAAGAGLFVRPLIC